MVWTGSDSDKNDKYIHGVQLIRLYILLTGSG